MWSKCAYLRVLVTAAIAKNIQNFLVLLRCYLLQFHSYDWKTLSQHILLHYRWYLAKQDTHKVALHLMQWVRGLPLELWYWQRLCFLSCQAYDVAGQGECHEEIVSWMLMEGSMRFPLSLLTHDVASNKLWQLLCENPLLKLNWIHE